MSESQALWHGGAPGRQVGELLLPPNTSGVTLTSGVQSLSQGLDQIAYRSDLVYVTSDKVLAKCFASAWVRPSDGRVGFGWVYRVVVAQDDLKPDEDILSSPSLSYQCHSARVVVVYEKAVAPHQAKLVRYAERLLANHERSRPT